MIEPMKKVSVVLLNNDRENSLKKLRKLGLLHLEKLEGNSEKLAAFKEYSNNSVFALSVLGSYKISKKYAKKGPELSDEKIIELCTEIVSKSEQKKQILDEIASDANELERFEKWGEVSLEDLAYLKEKNIQISLYEIPVEKYPLIDGSVNTLLLSQDKKTARFLLLNGGDSRPENLLPEAFELPLPRISTVELENEIRQDEEKVNQIDKFFAENVPYVYAIKSFKKKLECDIEFENVNAGVGHENDGKDSDLAWISGYVPTADIADFEKACRENNWAVAFSDPDDEDSEVPTKLKNNSFVSLIYPLTDFLGTVPGYHEFDISGWFLLFFTIFFGMIFGDGGYGLIVCAGILALLLRNKIQHKPFSPLLGLGLLVGGATVVWGLVTCTWFGISAENLPKWLTKASIPLISSAYEDLRWAPFWLAEEGKGLTKDQNLQIFCFSLALFQLSVAHIKAAKRNICEKRVLKALGDIGSLLQLIGMFWVVLGMVVDSEIFPVFGSIGNVPVGKIAVTMIAVGFTMSFIFANYEGSVGKSILESCKNIISVLLGIVNVFSDIVSYIRLWAVGLAGAAISDTVNTLAGPILGHAVLFILAVLLLVFGHGLNMVLNLLSVIVHGVRLNTLEFSTHLGVSWSGIKYTPFSEK